jgi:predicted transcriptional regulator
MEGRLPRSRQTATITNNVQRLREDLLLSKAELARRAGVSSLTIDRIEAGKDCRLDTKRKIILGLGLTLAERKKVFAASAAGSKGNGR